jgi:4-nitrophenyl phosphatase
MASDRDPRLGRYRGFLLDIDGVLVHGGRTLPGAADALARLCLIAPVLLLTNNSTRSRRAAAARLRDQGLPVGPEAVLPSCYIAAQHLRNEIGTVRFWHIGEEGIAEEMALAGHEHVDPVQAEWVVVGMDRELTYDKLAQALHALLSGARLMATNRDATYPTENGLVPGAGAIVGALEGMGFAPELVVGKPSAIAYRAAVAVLGVAPGEVLMIGDRLETDILGAQGLGMDTVLVLSGISTLADVERQEIRPTWIARDLPALVRGELLAASPPR